MIEIIPRISGVDFKQAWERRFEAVIDEETGLKAFFISAEDFITNKLAAGRPHDLGDVEAVRRASELRPQPGAEKNRPAGPSEGGPGS